MFRSKTLLFISALWRVTFGVPQKFLREYALYYATWRVTVYKWLMLIWLYTLYPNENKSDFIV